MRSRWLLLFNCQAHGLAHCLNLMCDEIEVEHHDPVGIARHRERIAEALPGFDRVLVAPQVADDPATGLDLDGLGDRVMRVPSIYFSGYHPDTCYVDGPGGRPLRGPLGEYHSVIAYAAFVQGRTEAQAIALYRERTYARMRYFARWDAAWRRMGATFSQNGLDLAALRPKWSRRGPFMYTVNHPRIECLHDLAALVLQRAGHKARYLDALPADNLANGPVIPVFPAIATRLGGKGSQLFKRPGTYRHITLEEFVAESFAAYRAADEHAMRGDYAHLLAQADAALQGAP